MTDFELEELLQHHGVKGMKWGVRRKNLSKSKGQNGSKPPSRLRENLDSLKREREWKKVLRNIDGMSTKTIKAKTTRLQLENDLKRLSRDSRIGSPKDKTDYLRRGNMSDAVLSRKVTRLRAKENLARNVDYATAGQRAFGKKVLGVAGPLVLKYALTKSITPADIFGATVNTKAYSSRVKQQARQAYDRQREQRRGQN